MVRQSLAIASICVVASLSGTEATAQTYAEVDARGIPTIAPLLENVTKSVVNIAVVSEQPVELNPLLNDPFFRRFFDLPERLQQPQEQLTESLGSGVIIDADNGYVVTNSHVIEQAETVRVTLSDGRTFDAKIIGSDPETDVAIIQNIILFDSGIGSLQKNPAGIVLRDNGTP